MNDRIQLDHNVAQISMQNNKNILVVERILSSADIS